MNNPFAQRQQQVQEELADARDKIAGAEGQLREVDNELDSLSGQRQRYELLGQISDALLALEEMGEAKLFWGDDTGSFQPEQRMATIRGSVSEFREQMAVFEERRQKLRAEIDEQELLIGDLMDKLDELKELELKAQEDFVIEREERELPYRPMAMPWSREGEDQRRFRKVLLLTLLLMLLIGGVPMVWKLPPPDLNKPIEIPERIANMVKKKTPPKPPEKAPEQKKEEEKPKDQEKKEQTKPKEKPTPVEVAQARAKAETKGVLAFKDSFSDLMDESVPSQLGADSRLSNAGSMAGGAPGSRSLIVAQATGGSGGIANAQISRGGVGGGGGAITGSGVSVSKAQSAISEMKGEDKPLTKGAGPARTDEEIQIVFDKYKSALYRIYNRELRNDPTLRGKMVLAITIEPDGSVSACKVQSTDMNSATLSADIVARVMKFNFGAKAGVPTTKILYPIDFLPAS